ncbi:MAG: hypothetical protein KIT09_11220 [Bryobacteraceae bacterium]|nr:hypothetical protein [Bryobacteraceae bacterium]
MTTGQSAVKAMASDLGLTPDENRFLEALGEVFYREEFSAVASNFQVAYRFAQAMHGLPAEGEIVLTPDHNSAAWSIRKSSSAQASTRAMAFGTICYFPPPPRFCFTASVSGDSSQSA